MNDLASRFYRLKTLKESCEKRIDDLETEIAFLELDKDVTQYDNLLSE